MHEIWALVWSHELYGSLKNKSFAYLRIFKGETFYNVNRDKAINWQISLHSPTEMRLVCFGRLNSCKCKPSSLQSYEAAVYSSRRSCWMWSLTKSWDNMFMDCLPNTLFHWEEVTPASGMECFCQGRGGLPPCKDLMLVLLPVVSSFHEFGHQVITWLVVLESDLLAQLHCFFLHLTSDMCQVFYQTRLRV